MLKLYRNFLMAGVVSLGLAACGDDITVTEPPPTPPAPETPNITSFSVSPTSATIAPGTFVQASATLITKPGVTGAVTWASSNAAVATVDASGRIDALAEGTTVVTATATAGGQTATAAVGVTVRPILPAQVSIKSVTTGLTNLPVALNNVFGQIEVTLNFNPGEQLVDSVNVFIGNKRAAKQSFATSPAAGDIVLSINTANYVKNVAAGTATVDYQNGATTISAAVYPRGSSATATNTIQIVLNNADGWAADLTKPTTSANSAAGLTFWGGPGATGLAEATVYPVIYTPGRSIATVTFAPGNAVDGTCSTHTDTSLPFRATFGYTAGGATASAGGCGGAGGFQHTVAPGGARDNVRVLAAIDNANNPFPLTPLIANTVVLGSTPDSARFDWASPVVSTPSITRSAPAVTGWVNASFNFINFASTDAGVGIRATRDRAVSYVATNCGGGAAVAMPNGTGADIPECATNFIGGTPGLGSPGTAPYRVSGTESDRLGNVGTSGLTQTFGVDKTNPSIRWGLNTGVYAAQVVVAADSQFRAAKPVAADEYRVEYLDDRAGFFNAGAPSGGIAAQRHALSTAGHVANLGACVVGSGSIGAAFVTAPACTTAYITAGGTLRVDGWQGGMSVPAPGIWDGEGYWGYASFVTDAAGNNSSTLFRKSFVSTISPFATGLTVPATLSASAFAFGPTFADSTEVVRQSLQVTYPEALTLPGSTSDSLRYSRGAIGTVFDDAITSPYLSSISPNTGAPYVRHLEAVNAGAFPGSNIQAAPVNTKPVNVVAWSWNPGSILSGGPLPGRSAIIAIPPLLVQDGTTFTTFNTGNTTNSVTHFRIISTVSTANQFGSTAPLRAQAVSPTNTPNAPFARVDFYRLTTVGPDSWWSYLGSSTSPINSDQGTYRSWVYNAPGTFVNAWNGTTAQVAVAAGDVIMAVGVTAAGDGLAASTTMTP
ncbi:MAG TPA: Ig-like domain-containing protein [Gemmatimonadales bacterium]|nr:Ig-like domain-containing protein [Gemmatimonadales bacterium]